MPPRYYTCWHLHGGLYMVNLLNDKAEPIPVNWWKFPAGEIGCRIEWEGEYESFTIGIDKDYSAESIMSALMLSQAVQDTFDVVPDLVIPYLPYGRQDKIHYKGEGVSRDMMIKILSPNFEFITIIDSHSPVCGVYNIEVTQEYVLAVMKKSYTHIVFPDAGAKAKYKFPDYKTVAAVKTRDKATGQITSYKLEEEIPADAKVLVVDDICDGGRTFLELAKLLPKNRDLFVTHGIFSKGIELIEAQYDTVNFCTEVTPNV